MWVTARVCVCSETYVCVCVFGGPSESREHMYASVCVAVCALSGVQQGAVAASLVYVVGGSKVRGEGVGGGGGAWFCSGASSLQHHSATWLMSQSQEMRVLSLNLFFCFPLLSFSHTWRSHYVLHSGTNRSVSALLLTKPQITWSVRTKAMKSCHLKSFVSMMSVCRRWKYLEILLTIQLYWLQTYETGTVALGKERDDTREGDKSSKERRESVKEQK